MCKQHIPILVYDNGGTQKICGQCGKPMSEWTQSKPKKHLYKNLYEVKDEFFPNQTIEELENKNGRETDTKQLQIHVQDI